MTEKEYNIIKEHINQFKKCTSQTEQKKIYLSLREETMPIMIESEFTDLLRAVDSTVNYPTLLQVQEGKKKIDLKGPVKDFLEWLEEYYRKKRE